MGQRQFEVLDPEEQGSEWTSPFRVTAFDAEQAAVAYLQRYFSELEYPQTTEVWVRPVGATEHQVFDVEARESVDFYARVRRGAVPCR
jgi:hypothetical protein